ncbi:MAG TPA: hypothetical protein VIH99_11320 [Bdellovibrionota bacterium]|jgi:hypothetical protein
MRNALLFLSVLLFPGAAFAAKARFTTVFLDDEGVVYVGMRHADGLSDIVSFPFESSERTSIPLPDAISHRDVIGLLPEKQKLFVLTNGAGEPDDGPMLHVYDRGSGSWVMVGKIVCPTFTKVRLEPSRMIFSCEIGKTRKGKSRVARRSISLKRDRIYRGGVWRFPEFMLRYKGRVVLLEGPAPDWDRLRLRSDQGSQRTISAEDLVQLPLPGEETKSAKPTPNG